MNHIKEVLVADPEELVDTGDIAHVPEAERLDADGGDGSDAADGGDDTDGLDAIYENPGEVVPEVLG